MLEEKKEIGFSEVSTKEIVRINYLFLIAIGDYAHLPKLGSPVKDVKDVMRILLEKYYFSEDNCVFLFNEEATKKNIYHKFRELIKLLTPNDSIVIYYSGHGEYEQTTSMGYWIPYDGDPQDLSTFIENTTITSFIKAMRAKHILILADSSFSSNLFDRNLR